MWAVILFMKGHEFMQVFIAPLKFHRTLLHVRKTLSIFHSFLKLQVFPFMYINFDLLCLKLTNPTMLLN